MTDENNRRAADRHTVYRGAEITTEAGKSRSAITQDASATGFMLLTRARLEPGSRVSIRVYLPGDGERSELLEGHVVRRIALDPSESSLWREKVAVRFDHDAPAWLVESFVDVRPRQGAPLGRRQVAARLSPPACRVPIPHDALAPPEPPSLGTRG